MSYFSKLVLMLSKYYFFSSKISSWTLQQLIRKQKYPSGMTRVITLHSALLLGPSVLMDAIVF